MGVRCKNFRTRVDVKRIRKTNSGYFDRLRRNEEDGIMTSGEVQEKIDMKRNEIITEHEKYHKISQGSDGRWRTRLPDGSNNGKGRMIAKSKRSDLEEEIVNFYSAPVEMTIEQLYKEWLEYKKVAARATSSIAKICSLWEKYYKPEQKFISKYITKLTPIDIELWADEMIKNYTMNKKEYSNAIGILKQSLEYAVKKGYIEKSPYENAGVNKRLLSPTKKASNRKEVYTQDEQKRMERYMWQLYNSKPEYTAPLAIIFLFYTGLRNGELVALRKSDIEGDYLHIQRQETRIYDTSDDEHPKMLGYQIVNYTKSDAGDRKVPLVPKAKGLIQLILETNEKYGWADEDFLFVHGADRIHHGAIEGRIIDACDNLGMIRKTAHKIRKTYISTLYDAGVPLDDIRKIVGHEDDQTTLRCYCFSRLDDDQTFKKVEEALDASEEQTSVTPCNTKVLEFSKKEKCEEPA